MHWAYLAKETGAGMEPNGKARVRRQGARAWAPLALVPALLLVAACSPGESAIMAGTTIISYLATDKPVSDHIIGQITNKECSTKRLIDGGKYCVDENGNVTGTTVAQAEPSYCYHTLGKITCYTTPDPTDPHNVEVAWPRPPQPEAPQSVALRDGENKGN